MTQSARGGSIYVAFFAGVAVASTLGAIATDAFVVRVCMVWLALDGVTLAWAYRANRPELVMGKSSAGWRVLPCIVNLPWLALTWSVAVLLRVLSRENASDAIAGTNVWIGRRPSEREAATFDHVFDLTAEFPPSRRDAHCVPNLDGMPLANHAAMPLPSVGRILVHCAQGHGRSATWLAMQLVAAGVCRDAADALERIRSARPKAQPSRAQLEQLAREGRQRE